MGIGALLDSERQQRIGLVSGDRAGIRDVINEQEGNTRIGAASEDRSTS